MWKYTVLVALFAVGAYCNDEITPFATGGRAALPGEYTSACSIDSPFMIHCNGIVLDNRHILTTANCVTNGTALAHPGWFRVVCGNNNLFVNSPGRFASTVTHVYPHDQYVPNSNNNDLAVLRLAQNITLPSNYIEPAVFNPLPIPDLSACFYSGWGRATAAAPIMQVDKRVINAPVVNRATCNGNNMANPTRALESMVCAGLTATAGTVPEATCAGNIGGALYCNNEVVGILAFGEGCGAFNHPGVYIQTRLYTNWINGQLTRTDTIPAGTVYPRP